MKFLLYVRGGVIINYLVVDKCAIVNNCAVIFQKLKLKNVSLFIMVKSNLYGFGYELLSFIKKYISGVVVKDTDVLNKIDLNTDEFEIIKMYDDNFFECVQNCITTFCLYNSDKNKNSYIRVDPFLGLHGISLDQLKNIPNFNCYSGIFVYINEYMTKSELRIMNNIIDFAKDNDLFLNVGGSKVLDYKELFLCEKLEIRLLREILFSKNSNSTMKLHCKVINSKIIENESITIGFKDDRRVYDKGFLYLISFGYDDFKLLPLLYKNEIKLKIDDDYFEIASYPCMNTTWIYSKQCLLSSDNIVLFDDFDNIKKICNVLDIDIDEFYSSYSMEINRVYE